MLHSVSQSEVQQSSKERVVSIPALGLPPLLTSAGCPTLKIPTIRRPRPDGTRQPNGKTQHLYTTLQGLVEQDTNVRGNLRGKITIIIILISTVIISPPGFRVDQDSPCSLRKPILEQTETKYQFRKTNIG